MTSGTTIGAGNLVSGGAFSGVLTAANTRDEVIALVGHHDLGQLVLWVDSPSATALVPLMMSIKGVICGSGGPTSHLALVASEFGLPCVMAAAVDNVGEWLGHEVYISADGQIDAA